MSNHRDLVKKYSQIRVDNRLPSCDKIPNWEWFVDSNDNITGVTDQDGLDWFRLVKIIGPRNTIENVNNVYWVDVSEYGEILLSRIVRDNNVYFNDGNGWFYNGADFVTLPLRWKNGRFMYHPALPIPKIEQTYYTDPRCLTDISRKHKPINCPSKHASLCYHRDTTLDNSNDTDFVYDSPNSLFSSKTNKNKKKSETSIYVPMNKKTQDVPFYDIVLPSLPGPPLVPRHMIPVPPIPEKYQPGRSRHIPPVPAPPIPPESPPPPLPRACSLLALHGIVRREQPDEDLNYDDPYDIVTLDPHAIRARVSLPPGNFHMPVLSTSVKKYPLFKPTVLKSCMKISLVESEDKGVSVDNEPTFDPETGLKHVHDVNKYVPPPSSFRDAIQKKRDAFKILKCKHPDEVEAYVTHKIYQHNYVYEGWHLSTTEQF
ncbi:hypothetical protein [Salmon gill poxvirus]